MDERKKVTRVYNNLCVFVFTVAVIAQVKYWYLGKYWYLESYEHPYFTQVTMA